MITNELRRIADVIDRVLGADATSVFDVEPGRRMVTLFDAVGAPVLDKIGGATRSDWYPRSSGAEEQRNVDLVVEGVRFVAYEKRPIAQPVAVPA